MMHPCKDFGSSICNNCLCSECVYASSCYFHKKELRLAEKTQKHNCVVKKCKKSKYHPNTEEISYEIIHDENRLKEFEDEVYEFFLGHN